ncbi:universal stress protein family protein [Anaerotignum neopropionicum]|uniref:Universal stress protein family protein n=1 Tax=Anaerotignum neopropionicum TaxID=36847 RepID=A0A136WC98_9FIRM|nr:universal stress protein [Anaerotignum neopropionicum]KXL52141.1 universal stress protein family protein [Anaerotignum neopropionicum]
MRKILLPIDGSERSMKAIEWVETQFSPNDVDITILIVREDLNDMRSMDEYEQAKLESQPILQKNATLLNNFIVDTQFRFGRAGEEILTFANQNNIDTIVMTKSTKSGWSRFIGSVTTHVVKYANCVIVIVPER